MLKSASAGILEASSAIEVWATGLQVEFREHLPLGSAGIPANLT
jgi:hypothetical protein